MLFKEHIRENAPQIGFSSGSEWRPLKFGVLQVDQPVRAEDTCGIVHIERRDFRLIQVNAALLVLRFEFLDETYSI